MQEKINAKNRFILTNTTPTIVCSNCTGGYIYHWLGLRFLSPFINLFLWPKDFVTALENWEEFISSEILEVKTDLRYPVGKVITKGGTVPIHFMHYKSFDEAIAKWNERKLRMEKDPNKIGFMLTNWEEDVTILNRFCKLPFKHKIAFTHGDIPEIPYTCNLKGLDSIETPKQVFYPCKFNGMRFIDQFDYVSFINNLSIPK